MKASSVSTPFKESIHLETEWLFRCTKSKYLENKRIQSYYAIKPEIVFLLISEKQVLTEKLQKQDSISL